MKTIILSSVLSLLMAAKAFASPIFDENIDDAKKRIQAAAMAKTVTEIDPSIKRADVLLGHAVIELNMGATPDPLGRMAGPAHSASVWLAKRHKKIDEWLINVSWEGALIGVQFRSIQPFDRSIDMLTSDAWLRQVDYNGGSLNGVIKAYQWCATGANTSLPKTCDAVWAGVESRGIEHLVGKR